MTALALARTQGKILPVRHGGAKYRKVGTSAPPSTTAGSYVNMFCIAMVSADWQPGTVVWAQVQGYPWWPALVVPYEQFYFLPLFAKIPPCLPNQVTVMFFRDGTMAILPRHKVVSFEKNLHHVNIRGKHSANLQLAYVNARQFVQKHGVSRRLLFLSPDLKKSDGGMTDAEVMSTRARIEATRAERINVVSENFALLQEIETLKTKLSKQIDVQKLQGTIHETGR